MTALCLLYTARDYVWVWLMCVHSVFDLSALLYFECIYGLSKTNKGLRAHSLIYVLNI